MPCWFAEDHRATSKITGDDRQEPIKKIVLLQSDCPREIESPAEKHYIAASKLGQGEPYKPNSKLQADIGILARITVGGKKKIIIAGIHQYGTWIVADFFARLSNGENVDYRDVFLEEDDFVAVVWGEFNPKKLSVFRVGVHDELVWRKKASVWERVPPKDRKPSVTT